jgi:hypothetical protein
MTLDEAIAKATKLIRLSQSSNPHEAALAAQRAQEILTRYEIDRASLSLDGGEAAAEPDEPIEDFTRKGAPLDDNDGKATLPFWKGHLASTIAKANQARVYQIQAQIGIIGRPSDVEKVRYLYAMLVRETDRLAEEHGKGCGRTWRNQFRLGVVDAIAAKLAEAREKVAAEMRGASTGTALVRVNQAIELVRRKDLAVDAWIRSNLRLRTTTRRFKGNEAAREAGREAGKAINISGARGALGSANKQLK